MMEDSNAYIITISLVIQGFEIAICVIKLSGWISWWGGGVTLGGKQGYWLWVEGRGFGAMYHGYVWMLV